MRIRLTALVAVEETREVAEEAPEAALDAALEAREETCKFAELALPD
jgi:hypothetical protein